MATTLFESATGGLLYLTRASNGAGNGTRLELYATAANDRPVEIREPDEAKRLADQLIFWAMDEEARRRGGDGG